MAKVGDTGGLKSALAMLGAAGRVDADGGPAQDDLFEAPGPLPLPMARPEPTGQRGRRAGVPNRSTEEWSRFLLSQYRSPLTGLAELFSRPLEGLVDELQRIADKHKRWKPDPRLEDGGYWERVLIDPLEVLKLQKSAKEALAPYVHKRQPVALEVDQRQPGIVVIGNLDLTGAGGADDLALPLPPTIENATFSELSFAASDDDKSETLFDQTDSSDAH